MGGVLGRYWASVGAILGPSWGILEPFGGPRSPSGATWGSPEYVHFIFLACISHILRWGSCHYSDRSGDPTHRTPNTPHTITPSLLSLLLLLLQFFTDSLLTQTHSYARLTHHSDSLIESPTHTDCEDVSADALVSAPPRGGGRGGMTRARSRPDCGDVSGGLPDLRRGAGFSTPKGGRQGISHGPVRV